MDTFQIGELTQELLQLYIDYSGVSSVDLSNKDIKTWVCVIRNKIIGHMVIHYNTGYSEPSYMVIKELNVNKEYRRHGVGNCLLSDAKDWAILKSCQYIDIIVPNINEPAKKFVIKAGGVYQTFVDKHTDIYTFKVDSNDQV